jgi:hypothetical protein
MHAVPHACSAHACPHSSNRLLIFPLQVNHLASSIEAALSGMGGASSQQQHQSNSHQSHAHANHSSAQGSSQRASAAGASAADRKPAGMGGSHRTSAGDTAAPGPRRRPAAAAHAEPVVDENAVSTCMHAHL